MASKANVLEIKDKSKFEDVAFELRNCVKTNNFNPLQSHLIPDNIIDEECKITEELYNFVFKLIGEPQTNLKVTSSCSDFFYEITKGRCKPAKNVTLGLAVKFATSHHNAQQIWPYDRI